MTRREFIQSAGRPRIICLCGSTRFIEHFAVMAWEIEKGGAIALGCHLLPASYGAAQSHQAEIEGVSDIMDRLHRAKIDLADEVLVLNIGGYIGQSTRGEIEYATAHGKPVRYLEPTMKIRLWFIRETDKARLYSKLPPERHPEDSDRVWIPRSLVEHTTKYANGQHVVDVPDWFAERENL